MFIFSFHYSMTFHHYLQMTQKKIVSKEGMANTHYKVPDTFFWGV